MKQLDPQGNCNADKPKSFEQIFKELDSRNNYYSLRTVYEASDALGSAERGLKM